MDLVSVYGRECTHRLLHSEVSNQKLSVHTLGCLDIGALGFTWHNIVYKFAQSVYSHVKFCVKAFLVHFFSIFLNPRPPPPSTHPLKSHFNLAEVCATLLHWAKTYGATAYCVAKIGETQWCIERKSWISCYKSCVLQKTRLGENEN